ncbi:hypothetical protein HDU92_002172 [Lobulomyces angularis]|nr:hypothetical protein HDU92_002172 [Lobulomyces angularis]
MSDFFALFYLFQYTFSFLLQNQPFAYSGKNISSEASGIFLGAAVVDQKGNVEVSITDITVLGAEATTSNISGVIVKNELIYYICSQTSNDLSIDFLKQSSVDIFITLCKNKNFFGNCAFGESVVNFEDGFSNKSKVTNYKNVYNIVSRDYYKTFLVQCGNFPVSGVIESLSLTNNWTFKHLDYNGLFTFYFSFPVAFVWLFTFFTLIYSNRHLNSKLRVINLLDTTDTFCGLATFSLYLLLLLITKGYTVIRLYLSPLEWRGVISVSVFFGFAMSMYSAFYFNFPMIIFLLSTYFYLFYSLKFHLESYMYVVQNLKRKYESRNNLQLTNNLPPSARLMEDLTSAESRPWWRFTPFLVVLLPDGRLYEPLPKKKVATPLKLYEDWDLIGVYEAKLWIMCMVQRIITYYSVTTAIVRLASYLQIFNSVQFALLIEELAHLLGFLWICYVFRKREVFQVIDVPDWLLKEGKQL